MSCLLANCKKKTLEFIFSFNYIRKRLNNTRNVTVLGIRSRANTSKKFANNNVSMKKYILYNKSSLSSTITVKSLNDF